MSDVAATETKVCPFRRGKDGEFLPCYCQKCMAYYEYEQPVTYVSVPGPVTIPPTKQCGCYNIVKPVYQGGSCV